MTLLKLGVLAAATALVVSYMGRDAQSNTASHPLRTAVLDQGAFTSSGAQTAFAHTRAQGASVAEIIADWSMLAPTTRPRGFAPANPRKVYTWAPLDRQVRAAVAHKLTPLLIVTGAPRWAQRENPDPDDPTTDPDPRQYALFAKAIATHYDGSTPHVPRVRYWGVWNEPNISLFLRPQFHGKVPYAPILYRRLVVGFAASVKGVHADNLVVAGNLAPFRDVTPKVMAVDKDWGPLSFMRSLFCLSPSLKRTCQARLPIDVWAMHPYTSGGPGHKAVLPNDVSIGDLGKVNRVLAAAVNAGNLARMPQFWVTEFSWDSSPPDPRGVPVKLLRRWVPQALYEMWQDGVSLVTWFSIRDQPLAKSFYQAGLYTGGSSITKDKPKPYAEGFRFPFVAFPDKGGVYVWLRTPWGKPHKVVVEQLRTGRWRRVTVLATDRYGIADGIVKTSSKGDLRAQLAPAGEKSLQFSLAPVPDHFYNPFGEPTLLEPKAKKTK